LLRKMSRKMILSIAVSAFLLLVSIVAFLPGTIDSFATGCASGDIQYTVRGGDTLSAIAAKYNQTYVSIQQYNHIVNANLIYIGQTVCILTASSHTTNISLSASQNAAMAQLAIVGFGDPFEYGQCTYWASLRYHEISGKWVPWTTQSNANQWVARAVQYRWNVSSTPTIGSIAVFQSGVQGAFSLGHLAIVERLLGNGQFVGSSMNWNGMGAIVAYTQFHQGSGVSFITY
jgi:N-acetylmuramoyl-L-alanine amidase